MANSNLETLIITGLILIGSVGMVYADSDNHDVLRGTQGQIVRSTNNNCVRINWTTNEDPCAPRVLVQQQQQQQEWTQITAAELTQEQRTVYFKFDHYDLLSESKERLDTLANVLKADNTVKGARVVGFADRIGSVDYNDKLSQKRALAVRDYLVEHGYTNARVTETQWVGKSMPTANCPGKKVDHKLIACLQNDRRVEVQIDFIRDDQEPVTQ